MIGVPLEPTPVVQTAPQDLYQAAVADRLAGRPEAAVPKLQQVLAQRPEDVDARLNLGLALLALNRLDEAEAAFREVTVRTPGYADAWLGLARVEQRRGNLAQARRLADEALLRSPGNTEVRDLQRALAPEPAWRMDAGVSYSTLSRDLPSWTEARMSASRRLDDRWTVGGGIEATRRFDNTDIYFEARMERRHAGGFTYAVIGGAPDADYRPEVGAAVGGEWRLAPMLSGTVDASAARYRSGVVTGVHPGAVLHLADDRLLLSARWINVWDERDEYRSGYSAAARWQATDRLALSLGHSDAPETSDGITVDVVSWSLGAEVALDDRLLLRIGGVTEDRNAYDRKEVSLGFGWRF